jgi:hypothetical protein
MRARLWKCSGSGSSSSTTTRTIYR